MLINKTVNYEEGLLLEINKPSDKLYYKFDYDSRNYDVNMKFQHFHNFYEIFILFDQSAAHIIEGEFYEVQPFDIVAIKSNVLHKTVYPKGSPKKRLIINFIFEDDLLTGLKKSFKELLSIFEGSMSIYRFPQEEQKIIIDLLNELFVFTKKNDPLKPLIIHHKFIEFLYYIYSFKDYNIYKPEKIQDSIIKKVYSITSFIHNNFREELSLNMIADKFFVSSYYLSHKFKTITGFTLINYIQMTRIRNAQQLLLSTNMKITEIAEKCGFSSFSQFNRVFRKYTEVSPSTFRIKGMPSFVHFN